MNYFIVIMGAPASGKSFLSKELGKLLKIPVISKDELKESLFDTLGYSDRNYSKKIGIASFELMYLTMEKLARINIPFIVETTFSNPKIAESKINLISDSYKCKVLLINIGCQVNILKQRFLARIADGSRHPGHVDHLNLDEIYPPSTSGFLEKLLLQNCTVLNYDSAEGLQIDLILQNVNDWKNSCMQV